MINTNLGLINTPFSSFLSVLYGYRNDSSYPQRSRERRRERRRNGAWMRYGVNGGERELRGRMKKTRSDCTSNSMRGRFGSPIFGPEHFQAQPLRPLQTRPPPRIELSVQISILTANLPANSPLLLVLLALSASTLHRQLSSQCRFFLALRAFHFRLEL